MDKRHRGALEYVISNFYEEHGGNLYHGLFVL